jgi:hypothetical protein
VAVRLRAVLSAPETPAQAGLAVLIAAVVMTGAVFAPFATQGCGLCRGGGPFPSLSLFQGLDGWTVLGVVVVLGLIAVAFVCNVQYKLTAFAMLAASLGALALGVFDGVAAGGRIMGWVSYGFEQGPYGPVRYIPEHIYYPPVYLDDGFYLFVVAAVVAVIASVVIVLTVKRSPMSNRRSVSAVLI